MDESALAALLRIEGVLASGAEVFGVFCSMGGVRADRAYLNLKVVVLLGLGWGIGGGCCSLGFCVSFFGPFSLNPKSLIGPKPQTP